MIKMFVSFFLVYEKFWNQNNTLGMNFDSFKKYKEEFI